MNKLQVRLIPCGPYANESEKVASDTLKQKLVGAPDLGPHIILCNLPHSSDPLKRSDEIDLIDISSGGVVVIEVKHWDFKYLDSNLETANREAEKLNAKVKRVAGKIRRHFPNVGFVEGRFLFTKGEQSRTAKGKDRQMIRGIPVFSLADWREVVAQPGHGLNERDMEYLSQLLEPSTKLVLTGALRNFAGITNLELVSQPNDHFHRIYNGVHQIRRDRVELHIYDLSADEDKNPFEKAKREFETLQQLQKSRFLPRVLDSFQQAVDYPGELYFYSLIDPLAPSLAERAADFAWSTNERLSFAIHAFEALNELHNPKDPSDPAIVHRSLNPDTIRARRDGQPLFTGLNLVKLPGAVTVSSVSIPEDDGFLAPEVLNAGFAAADFRSDIFAICASLETIFTGSGEIAVQVMPILGQGLSKVPKDRSTLMSLRDKISGLLETPSISSPSMPSPRFWDEETIIKFQKSHYRVMNRLGSGGVGITFKVLDTGTSGREEYGGYVAKVITLAEDGEAALHAYRRARPHTHPNLAVIHEIASGWEEHGFVALLKWVQGTPLNDLAGVLPVHAEDVGEDTEKLIIQWLRDLTGALSVLHRAGLVHGDVSPSNIIVSNTSVTLTDFDTVVGIGEKPRAANHMYSSTSAQLGLRASDDVFSLAATFFHVIFDVEPFRFGAVLQKEKGLNWTSSFKDQWPKVCAFLEQATHPEQAKRFYSAIEALKFLEDEKPSVTETLNGRPLSEANTPNEVPLLLDLLRTYPGSLHGNTETRGLDSDFAVSTYVNTKLDDNLAEEIQQGRVNLVILFGNAGDGKTAFLQNLASTLGLPRQHSAKRLWDHVLPNGIKVRANLDGSASFQGQGAIELLDEFFSPFDTDSFEPNLVHLVAVNSGPLKAWIEHREAVLRASSSLTEQLRDALEGNLASLNNRFRFLDLNARSLVGHADSTSGSVRTEFLDELLNRLLGVENQKSWKPCETCTAQDRCTAWNSVRLLRDEKLGLVVKHRVYEALQAVHQRGEVHITARELRATLSYIFFGLHKCTDLHANSELVPESFSERAFNPDSPNRQGEVLAEFSLLDPAFEAHSRVDRKLVELIRSEPEGFWSFQGRQLSQARRLAYFLWSKEQLHEISGDSEALGLAHGRHLKQFSQVPFMTPSERQNLCAEVCAGISRLENLPELAFRRPSGVPLKIVPRTPTESAFWVEKPLERFTLEACQPVVAEGLEALHTRLELTYKYGSGHQEVLSLGAELFHVLLELRDGVQLTGEATESTFANLAIFTQRLAQEDSRELFAWNPIDEEAIFCLRAVLREGVQVIENERLSGVV